MQRAKWVSEALQTAVKRGEAAGEGEKERCTSLNAEHQRIARRENSGGKHKMTKNYRKTGSIHSKRGSNVVILGKLYWNNL